MSQNNPFTINQVKPKFKSKAIHYIIDKEIKGTKALALSKIALTVIFLTFLFLIIFSNQQANADCIIDGVQYDIGGRAGSGVTAVDHSRPIHLDAFSGWDTIGDDVSTCDVSHMTNLRGAFHNKTSFNQDISSWDTGSARNMSNMFYNNDLFNQDISGWDTSSVTNISYMFNDATAFNGDISSWDTSSVTNISYMFSGATAFNGDISSWDTSSMMNMSYMFNGATAFNQNISGWDTSSATTFRYMFRSASSFNQDIFSWDTSSVTTFVKMFWNATAMASAYSNISGSSGESYENLFDTSPTLSSSTPADNATNVIKDGTIVLNFSENVVVGSGNITIKIASSNVSIETIEVNNPEVTGSGTSQITIDPQTNWGQNTEYYVLIDATAFDDTSGNSYEGISSTTALTFTVANDTPILSTSVPANNATSVALDANIVLNFSENVTAQSGNIIIKKADNTIFETISVTDTTKVTGTGTNQITINPSSDFVLNTDYYVLIDGTAFDDSSGGSYAGIGSTTALTFTSFANVLPTLSSSTPADDAPNVARDANIVLNFSENVTVQTGNITIKKTTDNTIFETIDVAGSKVTGTGTSQITINPSSNFDAETEYYVLIDGTAFDDTGSGSYAGISSTTALSFSVESMVDPTTDKDTTGSIDAQSTQIQSTFIKSISTVSTRLSYLRQNRSNDNFAKNNIKLEGGNVMLTSLVKTISNSNTTSPKLYLTKLIPDNWSPWSEGSISLSKIKNNSSEIESQSLAFGFDRKLNNNNLLGFAIQYGQSDTDIGTSGTGIDSKNYNLSLYQTRPLNDDNFIEGLIGVGIIEKNLTRKSGDNTLTGSRDGAQIFGSINYGKTIDKGDFNLTPIARVDLGYTELDAYTETGTDALSYDKQTVESGMVSLGLEFNDIINFSNSSFKPFGLVEYGLDFSNSSDVQMNYVSDTSTTYTYTQSVNSTHLLTSEVGFNYEALENLNIKTSYKRIQGNENEHIDTVKFAFKFKSRRETEYAMSLDGNEDFKTGFDITKNINGFDLNFNANQSFNETFDREAKVSLSSVF
ncbi:BspA family leucine-rich repeat surface protein [Candidatus Pelagibacter sp. Uisw_116]|uniref:BspA family leucine-rich repeat surface protein n=1 Tax=Candidatus Pelagibacter sp. Uisw_116 TaxID=3230986 RepID=UPI0039E86A41